MYTDKKKKKIPQAVIGKSLKIGDPAIGRYEREVAKPSIEMAVKLTDALDVSLDYLTARNDVEIDKILLDKLVSIQKLQKEDRDHIKYSIDGLIQHAKTRVAYKK